MSDNVTERQDAALAAWKHFNDRVRGGSHDYGPFTNADWQAACALHETIVEQRVEIGLLRKIVREAHGWLKGYGFEDGPGIFNGLMGRMRKLADAAGHQAV